MSSSKLNLVIGYVEWMEEAFCKQSDPDLWHHDTPEGTLKAKALCREHCPVIEKCLKFAMDNDEREGVWGGTSPGDRTKLRGGTDACAKNHPGAPPEPARRKSGEWRCKVCSRAYYEAKKEAA